MEQPQPSVAPAPAASPKVSKAKKLALIVAPTAIVVIAAAALWYVQEKKQDAADLAEIQASWDAYNASMAWAPFTPGEGGFTIDFPGTPLHETNETLTDANGMSISYDVYTGKDTNGIAYSIHVAGFPGEGRPLTSSDLENGLESMLADDEYNELVSSEASEVEGRPVLDVVIDNGTLRLRSRLIANGNTMVQLIAVGNWETNDGEAYEKFRDSLVLP
ncbi:MAG: hypothetical protein QY323_05190 [Patescibacteria group bacterium]|nr:MAG: hypothetical protein QY323_05190 [Patescibacteria group bacterium]